MISIIISAHNEENAIVETVNSCKKILTLSGNETSEIIVIDDGSSDNTFNKAKETGAKVIRHPCNIGYGRSLKDGINAASNDMIVIIDADGTYSAESIPELISEYRKGFNMVVGARQGTHYDSSFKKKIIRKILKMLVEFTTGRSIPDINSGLRIFSKKDFMLYINNLCDGFSFTTSLTLTYLMSGKTIKYIPINYHRRVGKTKVKIISDSLRTLQFIIEAILYFDPIKIFIVFSLILIVIAFLNFLLTLFLKLNSTFFIGIGCIMLSILMFGLGLIAVLLKQILHNKT